MRVFGGRRPPGVATIKDALAAAGYRPVVTRSTGDALSRREVSEPAQPYVLGDLTLDFSQRRVTLDGRQVQLTPNEYGMLPELPTHAGRVLIHEHLLERAWGERGGGSSLRPIRTLVSKLRHKLGDDADNPTYIFTEPRVGFRMPKGGTAAER